MTIITVEEQLLVAPIYRIRLPGFMGSIAESKLKGYMFVSYRTLIK